MANQRIILIGGSGYIGTQLAISLEKDGYEVYITSRKDNDLPDSKVLFCDLLNKDSIFLALKEKNIDIVINLVSVITSINKKKYIENIKGMENLISCMNKVNIKKMIFFSTANVNLKELGPYAKSKLESENLLINSKIEYIIIRPNIIYGSDTKNDFFQLMRIAHNLKILPIVGNKNKKMIPLHVDTLIDFTKKQVENFKGKSILEIAGSEVLSMMNIADIIKKEVGKKVLLLPVPSFLLSVFSFIIPFDIDGFDEDRCSEKNLMLKNKVSLKECLQKMHKELL